MNSIYPYPMDGDIVSYKNEKGEYVYNEIQVEDNRVYIECVSVGSPSDMQYILSFPDLQWIKRKDGTPLVNVGDEVLRNGCWRTVLEVGVNSYMICDKSIYGEWVGYCWLPRDIKRKYPLPGEEVGDKKDGQHFTVHNLPEDAMQHIKFSEENPHFKFTQDGRCKTVIPKSKSKEVTMDEIAKKFGVDVEDLKIKKEE